MTVQHLSGADHTLNTYKLSWDEFLEFQRESRPGPSYATILAFALTPAVAMATFGALLHPIMHPANELAALGLCWFSIVLFIAAFMNVRIGIARSKSWDVHEARAQYERYYSGERAFEFDAEKFVIQTESGRQEMLWANLWSAVEYRNFITLVAKGQLTVVIPKRALNLEELENLRQIVLNPMQTWHSRLNLLDYLLTEVALLWRSHPVLLAAAHLAGISCFIVLANDVYSTAGPEPLAKWVFLGLFLFLTITAEFWHLLIVCLAFENFQKTWEVGFSSNGLYFKTPRSNSFEAWTCFVKAKEVLRCFLLYTDISEHYLLPKHCIPAELQSAVKQTFQIKLCHAANRLQDIERRVTGS
jgi:hypothetical protein